MSEAPKPEDRASGADGSTPQHESRDIDIRAAAASVLGLAGLLVLALVSMAGLFWWLVEWRVPAVEPLSPFMTTRLLPSGPRLQVSPPLDARRFQREQNEQLNSYGWVDEKAGIVHIPIDRAMDLLLQRDGLPRENANGANGANGSHAHPNANQ